MFTAKRTVLAAACLLALTASLVSCAAPAAEVVEVEKVVEQTVEVEKVVEVDKTVEVEVEVVVTATPEPARDTIIVALASPPAVSYTHLTLPTN